MASRTTYPAQIDTNATLPIVIDNLTPVTGSVYNRLQEAVIRIEQELGVKPSGTYTTVRARLDALEGMISRLDLNVQFSGNIEVQTVPSLDPTIQHVIGIRGNPIVYNASIPTGATLRFDGTNWNQTNLYQDDILPPFSVTLNGHGMAEVNETLAPADLAFYATYNFDPPDSITLTDSDGHSQSIAIVDKNLFYSNYTFTKTSFNSSVTFMLAAVHHEITRTASFVIAWGQKTYWGVGPAGYTSESDIKSLATSSITNVLGTSFTVTAGATEKIYFACRTGYGVPTFYVGGFEGGFTLVSTTISLTNSFGFTENYTLYESDNLDLAKPQLQ